MSKRLLEYMDAAKEGGFGWLRDYEARTGQGYAWLAGNYQGMLDELIQIVGEKRARRLVAASVSVDESEANHEVTE